MKITFYSNKSDAIVVDKKINSVSTIDKAKIINETDILNPSIIVSRNFYDSLFSQANYLYIDKLLFHSVKVLSIPFVFFS